MNERRHPSRPGPRRAVGATLLAILLSLGLMGCELSNTDLLERVKVEFARPSPTRVVTKDGAALTIPLRVQTSFDGSVLVLVPVRIDGKGPYNFALDTGASRSLIDQRLAEELELPTVGRAQPVVGVFGVGEAEQVAVDDWQLGEVDLPSSRAVVVDLPGPNRGQGLRGLLGSDMLSTFGTVTIDYENEVLILGVR